MLGSPCCSGRLLTAVDFDAAAGYDETPAPENCAETVIIELRVWHSCGATAKNPTGRGRTPKGSLDLPLYGRSRCPGSLERGRRGRATGSAMIPITVGRVVWQWACSSRSASTSRSRLIALASPRSTSVSDVRDQCARTWTERFALVPLPSVESLNMVPTAARGRGYDRQAASFRRDLDERSYRAAQGCWLTANTCWLFGTSPLEGRTAARKTGTGTVSRPT